MVQAFLTFISSPAGILGVVCLVFVLVFALDQNYDLTRPISKNITKLGEPFTNQLLRTIFAFPAFCAGLYIVLSQQYDDETEKWAMSLTGMVVGAYLASSPKGGPPRRRHS